MTLRPDWRVFWRRVHNMVAHPLIEILPEAWGTWFHDETGRRAFPEDVDLGSDSS